MKKFISFFVVAFVFTVTTTALAGDVVTYKTQKNGKIVRLQKTAEIKNKQMLSIQANILSERCAIFEGLSVMSKEELEAAHTLWERYREPIKKETITIEQAIKNITKDTKAEIEAMNEALK